MKISTMPRTNAHGLLLAGAVAVFAVTGAHAQFTYPGCTDLATADFQTTELFNRTGANSPLDTNSNLIEPVQFDIQGIYNTAGDSVLYTNLYFVERKGKVKFYHGLNKTVDSIGFIPTWAYQSSNNQNDNGLMGLALDPNFNTNKWIYFWYSPTIPGAPATGATSSANRRLRLSRITVNSQNRLDMSTEKIMLDLLGSKTDQWHSGGPMTFDRHGDLWVTIGNNSNDLSGNGNQFSTTDSSNSGEWGSSNTASLRGGVIRIRPDNNATAVHTNRSGTYGPGYTVPAGNFGEYWGNQFQSQGNTTLAAEYRDTAKVRPEIYVKGTRSNYSIAIHPTKDWVGWGEVNYSTTNDEFNLVTNPVFTGMPYFHKNNVATPGGSFVHPVGHSVTTPINGSPLNSGVRNLPPVTMPVLWNASTSTTTTMPNNVAIGGPFYVYERNLKSSVKFPPHLHNSWVLMTTYSQPSSGSLWITKVDSVTPAITMAPQQQGTTGTVRFNVRNPVHAKYGPDGALYVLFYGSSSSYPTSTAASHNPGAIRIDYTGSCHLPPVSVRPDYRTNPAGLAVQMRRDGIFIRESGAHALQLHDLAGALVASRNGTGSAHYSYAALRQGARLEPGVYVVTIRTARGSFVRQVSLF